MLDLDFGASLHFVVTFSSHHTLEDPDGLSPEEVPSIGVEDTPRDDLLSAPVVTVGSDQVRAEKAGRREGSESGTEDGRKAGESDTLQNTILLHRFGVNVLVGVHLVDEVRVGEVEHGISVPRDAGDDISTELAEDWLEGRGVNDIVSA